MSFTLPGEKLAFYDVTTHAFKVDAGAYDIMVGSSSGDIRLKSVLEVR